MAFRLVQAVVESHGLEGVSPGHAAGAQRLRPDQVLLGAAEAPLVVATLERAGIGSIRVRPTLADPGRVVGGEGAPEAGWQQAAMRLGMLLPRPGQGEIEVVHRERLAAPGRLLVCAGPLGACGALGMLALGVDALVAAAVLGGGFLPCPPPRALGVRLAGRLPAGCCGADVALTLLARLRGLDETVDVVEFGGPGTETLSMEDRVGAAWVLGRAGLSALFPSDEITRVELKSQRREQDWRRLEAVEDETSLVWGLELGALEPLMAPIDDLADARPVRAHEGTAVERVLAGPGATVADFARVARQLAGGRVSAAVDCTLVAGSRSLQDAVARAGIVERLTEAGARVVEGPVSARAVGSGTGLCVGVPLEAVSAGRAQWWLAGAGSCGASARAGSVVAPRPCGEDMPRGNPETTAGPGGEPWLSAEAGDGGVPAAGDGETRGCFTRWQPPFRAGVLAVLGNDVENDRLLPSGARSESLRGRLASLASQVLAGPVPGFADRARVCGGGILVAGERFGRGEPRAAAALCLGELAVRAVVACSYAPGVETTLVHAGVMPLLRAAQAEEAALGLGDEIELPNLPDELAPDRPLTARNLSRGTQLTLRHRLSGEDIAVLKAGGLLPFVVEGSGSR